MKKILLISSFVAISGFIQNISARQEEAVDKVDLPQEKEVLKLLEGQHLLEEEELSYAIADLFKNKVAWFHFFDMLAEEKKPEIMGDNYYFMGKKYLFDFIKKKHPIPYHSLDHAADYFELSLQEAKKRGNIELEKNAAIGLAITKLLLVIYHKDNRYLIPRTQFLEDNLSGAKKLLQNSLGKAKEKNVKNAIEGLIKFHDELVIEQ